MGDPVTVAWLFLSALAAGVVNSMAGGGTLLTFPALLAALSGMGPAQAAVVANMTSTVALAPGSAASVWGFRSELARVRRWAWLLAGPSLIGGVIGSLLVAQLDPRYFGFLIPWLTLAAALLFLCQPMLARRLPPAGGAERPAAGPLAAIVVFQLLVGIYGGYFGAGIGIMMLGALSLLGPLDIHQMNALKNLLAFLMNGVSVVVFVTSGEVAWNYAAVMAVASILGGYSGARVARYLPRWLVRWTVIAVAFGLSAYFFYKRMRTGN